MQHSTPAAGWADVKRRQTGGEESVNIIQGKEVVSVRDTARDQEQAQRIGKTASREHAATNTAAA